MKITLAALSLLLATPAVAAEFNSENVLSAIDSICGDTWCEGDFNAEFQMLEFNNGQIELRFDLFLWSDAIDETRFPQSCTFFNYASLADTARDLGESLALSDRFYDDIGECMNRKTKEVAVRLDSLLTPEVLSTVCESVFSGHFDYDYSSEQMGNLCTSGRTTVLSLTPDHTDYLFEAKSFSGSLHICTVRRLQNGSVQVLECETH